jgi:hypothetical protein
MHAWGKSTATLLASPFIAMAIPAPAAQAREGQMLTIDLPEQRLVDSLKALALLSGRTNLADNDTVAKVRAPALRGSYTLPDALRILLAGLGLTAQRTDEGFVLRTSIAEAEDGADGIVVTGTRIRGARVASPTITLDQQDLRDTGYTDLGQIARSLPQSFGGGQNPGVGRNVPQTAEQNIGGSSSVNLRGLGSDATLTILNGRRLPYDGVFQGVDISAIPLQAVERLEVVADGASAIYGSDAVAGVVNVILRDDFEGVATHARVGGATDGGDFQQLYGGIAVRGGTPAAGSSPTSSTATPSSIRTTGRLPVSALTRRCCPARVATRLPDISTRICLPT